MLLHCNALYHLTTAECWDLCIPTHKYCSQAKRLETTRPSASNSLLKESCADYNVIQKYNVITSPKLDYWIYILEEYQNLSVTLCVTQQSLCVTQQFARMWMSLITLTYFDRQNSGKIEWSIKLCVTQQSYASLKNFIRHSTILPEFWWSKYVKIINDIHILANC